MNEFWETKRGFAQKLENVVDKAQRYLHTTHRNLHAKGLEEIKEVHKRLERQEMALMVAGDSSSGKSTLLNMLLGQEILPTSTIPCTSCICEIRYAPLPKMEVHHRNGDVSYPPLNPDSSILSQLKPYLQIEGEVRFTFSPYLKVVLHLDHELLKVFILLLFESLSFLLFLFLFLLCFALLCFALLSFLSYLFFVVVVVVVVVFQSGLVLVDKPGFSDNEIMTELTTHYATNACGIICVVNSSRAIVTLPVNLSLCF